MSKSGSVLVVERDDSIRSLLAVLVRSLPRRAVLASDGPSAMTLLGSETFDAVVMDLWLPELSGFDILGRLGREKPELLKSVIVVTALHRREWKGRPELEQVAAILQKPFAIDDLLAALRGCCDGH